MSPAPEPFRAERLVRLSSGLAVAAAVLAAGMLLFPRPLADAFFAGWVLVAVGLTVLGAAAAWTDRAPLAWIAALLLAALTIVGMWSIGFLIAPSALLLLFAAGFAQWAVPREPTQTRTDAPPTGFEAARKALAGAVLAVLGAGLFYEGVFVRELFTRGCASETLDCALAVTRWDAVGLAIIGLGALAAGAWLLWKQITVGRLLASGQPG